MGELYQQVCDLENLHTAYRKARRSKRGQAEVARFEHNVELELLRLQDELVVETYRPGAYRSFYRTEAKRRLISAAPFRDRVVHHALMQVIQPRFEARFIADSFANRVGKGTHRALDRCTEFMRASRYALPCDITQYFPSIDHALLRAELENEIPDVSIMRLIDHILATGVGVLDEAYTMVWFPNDSLFAAARPRGLPIGNLTSQNWANVYLNPLDQFIKRELKCERYLRYVDDFVLFADDKRILQRWRSSIIEFLAQWRLTLHENSAQVRPVQTGLTFLGFILFPTHRRLKPPRGYAFQRRAKGMARAYRAGKIEASRVTASVQGWVAHVARGNTYGLRRKVLSQVRLRH